mgnify:CR=1 FL=1
MKIREYLNQNSSIGILAAVVLLVISLFIIYRQLTGGGSGPQITELYYFDLNTGRVVAGPSDAIPPIDTDSGPYQGEPAGVRANIFACGRCDSDYAGMTPDEIEAAGAKLAYLMKYPPRAKQAMEEARSGEGGGGGIEGGGGMMMMEQELYRAVNDERWYSTAQNPEAAYQIASVDLNCPEGDNLRACYPGRR